MKPLAWFCIGSWLLIMGIAIHDRLKPTPKPRPAAYYDCVRPYGGIFLPCREVFYPRKEGLPV
jgi:hypothetical protein